MGAGQLFMLDPWEEVPLAVIPSRSSVVLPQTQQQVQRQRVARQTRAVQLCHTDRHCCVLQTKFHICCCCTGFCPDHLHAI